MKKIGSAMKKRREIDPTTWERDYSFEEIRFMTALDDYKRSSGRMFPTASDILEVVKALGYQDNSLPVDACHPPSPIARASGHGSPRCLDV